MKAFKEASALILGLGLLFGGAYMCQPPEGERLGDQINDGIRKLKKTEERRLKDLIREIIEETERKGQ